MSKDTPAVEMKMQPNEFAALRAKVAAVKEHDFHLGTLLESLVLHLAHAHGLDPATEDARLAAEAEQVAKDEEAAQAKAAKAQEKAAPESPFLARSVESERDNGS